MRNVNRKRQGHKIKCEYRIKRVWKTADTILSFNEIKFKVYLSANEVLAVTVLYFEIAGHIQNYRFLRALLTQTASTWDWLKMFTENLTKQTNETKHMCLEKF